MKTTKTPDQAAAFLAVLPADYTASRRGYVVEALQTIARGLADGSILSVDYKDAKRTLDYAAEKAYERATDIFWVGQCGHIDKSEPATSERNRALTQLHWDGRVGYVRDAIARSRLLAKTSLQHPMVDEMRRIVAALLPLALAMEELKPLVVKGRRPPTPEVAAERARKAALVASMSRGTCGCCFGKQAVLPNGRIHDHGYRVPSAWRKTASCEGRDFRPLEVSDEGPRYMVTLLAAAEANLVSALEGLRTAKTLKIEAEWKREAGRRIPVKWEDITPAHSEFKRTQIERIQGTESELASVRRSLAEFRKVVAEWKPA